MNKQRILIFLVILILFWGFSLINTEQSISAAIEGDYIVGYTAPSSPDNPIEIGTLILVEGQYFFTQQEGIEIPEHMIDRFFFVENPEGQYEVDYDSAYQSSQLIKDVEDGDTIAQINFFEKYSNVNDSFRIHQFIIRYNNENRSLSISTWVSEIELLYVIQYLE